MRPHIITKTYNNLKGFSTDSIFERPPNVATDAINIHREPDGTFTCRRGYQAEVASVGGLGLTSFDSPARNGVELVCLNTDGNLYRRITNTINIAFTSTYAPAWFQFSILTNDNIFNNAPGWNFEPWSTTPWADPNGQSITFEGFIKSAAIVNGTQTNVTTINVLVGHLITNGDLISVLNQENGNIVTRIVTSTTGTSVTFSGGTLSVNNNDRLDIFVQQLFLTGFDVASPYLITQFLLVLNSITGILAYVEGPTNFPAAFIPIQEMTLMTSGTNTTLNYYYWEKIPSPSNPLLPGSQSTANQNSPDFENASYCVYDEVLYCTNGYDFPVKYDGQNAYLSGMPKGERPVVSKAAAGVLTATNVYQYAITYEQKDNATHIIEGEISDPFAYTVGGTNESTDVAILDLEANSGYNTNGALGTGVADAIYGPDSNGDYYHYIGTAAGQTFIVGDTAYYQDRTLGVVTGSPAGAIVNIPVAAGYGIEVGDTIYFLDDTSVLKARKVVDIDTTVSPNLIEINGSGVTVSTNPNIYSYVESPVYGHVGIVTGNQIGVTTINLLVSGIVENNLVSGDLINFVDLSGTTVQRTIVTRTASTIVVDQPTSVLDMTFIYSKTIDTNQITLKSKKSAAITINNGDALSNDLRINIYRTQGNATQLTLVASIPNNSFSASQTYVDNLSDIELNLQQTLSAISQQQAPNPPPKCKYILTFENLVIYAGGSRNPADTEWSPDAFYFSKGGEPEAVPAASNFGLVPSNDDNISGLGQSGSALIVGKDRSIYSITGELLTSQFQVNAIAPGSNIGVAAHATMKTVGGLLYFLSNTGGVYTLVESTIYPTDKEGDPIPISKPIDALFRTKPFDKNKQFVLKRAVAINYSTDYEYLLFLPCENVTNGFRAANSNSIVLCYDYLAKNWFEWKNINPAGGFAIVENDLYWQERRFSGFVGDTANLYRQHRNYRLIDYADHTATIPVFWSSSWEDLQYPQVRKKFIRCMLYVDRVDSLYQLNNPVLLFSSYLDRFPDKKDTISAITTVNNSIKWSSAWSWKPWAGTVDSFINIDLKKGTTAKSMQISLQMNKLNTNFKFNGFQLEISPEYTKTFVR